MGGTPLETPFHGLARFYKGGFAHIFHILYFKLTVVTQNFGLADAVW
jgi:hypothetical protein